MSIRRCDCDNQNNAWLLLLNVYSSRKNLYPPHGRSMEIPRGRGVLKAKYLEAMYENKLEFPGGRGVQNKNLLWGEYRYFLELHSGWDNPVQHSKRNCVFHCNHVLSSTNFCDGGSGVDESNIKIHWLLLGTGWVPWYIPDTTFFLQYRPHLLMQPNFGSILELQFGAFVSRNREKYWPWTLLS